MAVPVNIREQNIDIVLYYFRPITLPPNPVTYDSTSQSSQSSTDNNVTEHSISGSTMATDTVDGPDQIETNLVTAEDDNQVALAMDKLDLKGKPTDDDSDCDSNTSDTNEHNFYSFIEKYGIEGAATIFNSIEQYPAEHMIRLLHSFEEQFENLTDETYKQLLQIEVDKLQNQASEREKHYKKHLIDILLESPDCSDMRVQKAMLEEFLSLDNLIGIVLEMKSYDELIEKKKEMEILLGEMELAKNNQYFKTICEKIMRQIIWDYAEKFLIRIEPNRGECTVCKLYPKEYVIVGCGHYCLCAYCKIQIEAKNEPKCPLCRAPITKIIRVFE